MADKYDGYVKVSRIPAILHNGVYSSFHYTKEGLLGERVKEEEADAILTHFFHIEKVEK
jgi:hypothetical protein